MDTKLEHDPKTKKQIKDLLYEYLYQPVQRQFQGRIDTLITRNTMMGGYSHKHFVYKGVVYNAETTQPPLKKNRLVPALRSDMEDYLKDLHALNNQELPYVLGYLNQVLNASNDLTDYLRCLPESVHYPLNQMMASCPCRSTSLNDEKVKALVDKNVDSIDLMKQRLARNLLI
jgi:hypothetical protein